MSNSQQIAFKEFEEHESVRLTRQWNIFQRNIGAFNEKDADELRQATLKVESIVHDLRLTHEEYRTLSKYVEQIKALYRDRGPL